MVGISDRLRTRQALVWWQARQIDRLHQETELIRDHVLQELFSLRRRLDQSSIATESLSSDTLPLADDCYQTLVQLSDRLFSPYAIENLELAVQERLDQWQQRYPTCEFHSKITGPIPDPAQPNYQFLLLWLDEVCRVFVEAQTSAIVTLHLHPINRAIALQITIQTPHQPCELTRSHRAQITHLRRVFRTLQGGNCQIQHTQAHWQCTIQWSPRQQEIRAL